MQARDFSRGLLTAVFSALIGSPRIEPEVSTTNKAIS